MPDLDITTDLRAGADNIHPIGPAQAATLLRAAAETIDALLRDFVEARQLASRYGIELGPHFAAHGEHARAANQRGTNIPYLGTDPLVERRLDPEARRLDNVTSEEAHRLLGLDKVQPHILGVRGRIRIVDGDPETSLGLAAEELQAAELVPPAERSSTMARIERWKKRQPTTPGAETYDFTPEQEAEAAEQAERFQGLDDSDRD